MGNSNSNANNRRTVNNSRLQSVSTQPEVVNHSDIVQGESSSQSINPGGVGNQNVTADLGNPKMASDKDIINKVKNLNISQKTSKTINILLLGETGVGKSTFINAIFNYLQHSDFNTAEKEDLNVLIPATFHVLDKNNELREVKVGPEADKNENLEVGSSATQGVKTYTFTIKGGKTLIRLIDTPGMGDTRGIEQDDLNCENILDYIGLLHELHAICYLCKPQQSRATAYFKYCVAQIMSRLEKSACKNFVFVFTNSRATYYSPGETLALLKQMAEEIEKNPAHAKIPLEKNTFCFDNEAFKFLGAVKNGVEFSSDIRKTNIESWKHSTSECWSMIDYIEGLSPHFVKHTSAINEARRIIYQLAQPMAEIVQLVNDNIQLLKNHRAHMDIDKQSLSELKKRLYIPVIDLVVTNLTQPVTVCADSKCAEVYQVGEKKKWHYKTRCHDPCYLNNVPRDIIGSPELMNCASMGPEQRCKICLCSYKVHMHVYYITKQVENQQKDDLVLKSINTKELVVENATRVIREIEDRKLELEKELDVIVKCNAKFAHFLQNNAIAPFCDSYAQYINHLIIREKRLGSNADMSTMASLERLLREHNEMKKLFAQAADLQKKLGKSDTINPQDIHQSINELFGLKLNGKTIKELYTSQKKSITKEHDYTEYVHKSIFSRSSPDEDKEGEQEKGKSSAANPTTKFQRGRSYNRGYYNNQRGRSGHHQFRHRSPPPSYEQTHNPQGQNQGYHRSSSQHHPPPASQSNYPAPPPNNDYHAPPPPNSGYHSVPPPPNSSYPFPPPLAPPRGYGTQPEHYPDAGSSSKPDGKPAAIQVNVTIPTPDQTKGGTLPPRNDPHNYPSKDYSYKDGYPSREPYPPRDGYPPRGPYSPRDGSPPRRDYPPYNSADPHYRSRESPYRPRSPSYDPRHPRYDPRDLSYDREHRYDPRGSHYDHRDPRYDFRDPRYDSRDSRYDPRYDSRDLPYGPRDLPYDPRDPRYDTRDSYHGPSESYRHPPGPSNAQYPNNPPPAGPLNYNPPPQGGNQQNFPRKGYNNNQKIFKGNRDFRGRGRGGINRKYKKKQGNANAHSSSGDESECSVASSKK